MKNIKKGILLMFLCTCFAAVGQLMFKFGSEKFTFELFSLLTNYYLILGFVIYAVSALLLILALKFGELSTLYPLESLNFVWVTSLSLWFLGEKLNYFKMWAIIFIIFGIILIAKGGEE